MLGCGEKKPHHQAPISDRENIENKIVIKKSCCSGPEMVKSHVWERDVWYGAVSRPFVTLLKQVYILDVSKPQCMFCILKDHCSHLQKT